MVFSTTCKKKKLDPQEGRVHGACNTLSSEPKQKHMYVLCLWTFHLDFIMKDHTMQRWSQKKVDSAAIIRVESFFNDRSLSDK